MWKKYLNKIKEEQEKYGERINKGITNEESSKIVDLNHSIVEYLQVVNGLDFNGYILYGIDGFNTTDSYQNIYDIYEYNNIFHDDDEFKNYLFIGESSLSWYVFDIEKDSYAELDNPSGRIIKEFLTLEEMLESILKESLE